MSAAETRVVADRYRLVEPLGQGGMGRVWMARDELLHRDVAIKELIPPPGLTAEERQEMRERAMREARAIARLSHPNVVRIFDILRTDGDPWIVMEYVRSRSLQETLAQDGPLAPRHAADVGLGMLAALRAAHRSGVVHRDIKPGNVLLGEDGRVVLTDFGLATIPGDPVVTRTGLVLGSPAYISPERARDGTAGPAADMWSLGATLYAAVEGQSPYARPSAIATLAALATEPPAPARRAGPLKPVLNGLLRKDPAERMLAEEAERLLMRAAGRRSRPGVSLLPAVRRPLTGGRRPTPRSVPVVAGVAAVPPPRRPDAEPAPPAGPPPPVEPPPAEPADQVEAPPEQAEAAERAEAADQAVAVEQAEADARAEPAVEPSEAADAVEAGAVEAGTVDPDVREPEPTAVEPAADAEPLTRRDDAEAAPEAASAGTVVESRAAEASGATAVEAGPDAMAAPPRASAEQAHAEQAHAESPRASAESAVAPVRATTKVQPATEVRPDRVRPSALDRVRGVPTRVVVAIAAALAVVVLIVLVLSNLDRGETPSGEQAPAPSASVVPRTSAPARATTQPPAAPTSVAAAPPTAEPTGAGLNLPPGWHIYKHRTGFSVAVPRSWRIEEDGTLVYFREQTGQRRVLGIDRTDRPKADPVKDWTQQEADRAHLKPNYDRVKIVPVDYFDAAADWEYTYDGSNGRLHARNRGFVTAPDQAHAILWITPDRTWRQNLDEFELIAKSFQPIP